MKRMLFIVAGALLFAALGFAIGAIATNWYSDHFAKSDDDISQSVGYFLLVWPLFAILGGYVGDVLFRQSLTLRSRERTDKRSTP
jgi:prolipoprotein diacylglyceryltransferase